MLKALTKVWYWERTLKLFLGVHMLTRIVLNQVHSILRKIIIILTIIVLVLYDFCMDSENE